MDPNDNIIELLNDIGVGKVKDEVFVDGDGEPTDLFLQALKSEFPRSQSGRTSSAGIHEEKSIDFEEISNYSRPKRPVTSALVTSKPKTTTTTRSRVMMKGLKPSKSGPSTGKRRKNATSRTRSPTREQIRESVETDKLVVNRKPSIEVRNSRAAEKRISYG